MFGQQRALSSQEWQSAFAGAVLTDAIISIVRARNREVSAVLLECFTCRTGILVLLWMEDEVLPAERPILARALVPDRNVRRDLPLDQPIEELASAISCVSSETLRLQAKSCLRA